MAGNSKTQDKRDRLKIRNSLLKVTSAGAFIKSKPRKKKGAKA